MTGTSNVPTPFSITFFHISKLIHIQIFNDDVINYSPSSNSSAVEKLERNSEEENNCYVVFELNIHGLVLNKVGVRWGGVTTPSPPPQLSRAIC